MPTHDPATVQTVARAIEEADASDPAGLATYDDLAIAALSAPPVAAAFAALAEVERLVAGDFTDDDWRWNGLAVVEHIRAALPTPTTEETTHA